MIATTTARRQAPPRRRDAPPALDDAQLLRGWLQGVSPNTEKAYLHEAAAFAAFLGRPLLSAEVDDLQGYAYHLQGGGLGLASQYRALSTLKSLFRFAVDLGAIDRDPARALRLPKPRDGLAARILTIEEVRAIVAAAKARIPTLTESAYALSDAERTLGMRGGTIVRFAQRLGWTTLPEDHWRAPSRRRYRTVDLATVLDQSPPFRDYVVIRFLYESGCRISEAFGLRWPDLTAVADAGVVRIFGKGNKSRTVRLGADVWQLLQRLRLGGTRDGPVFRTEWRGSRPLGRENFTRTMLLVARLAGLDVKPSPHWLRHSHASHCVDAGCPLPVLKEQLGHASLMSTERYLHVRPGESSGRYLPAIEGGGA